MFSVLVSIIFSTLPYYQVKEFKYKTEFIDNRDIEKEHWDINNLPTRIIDWLASLVYSIIASVCVNVVVKIFTFFLRFKELLNKTWREKLKILKKYIAYKQLGQIKREAKRNNLNKFFTNLLAYYFITGELKKKRKERQPETDDELISSRETRSFISNDLDIVDLDNRAVSLKPEETLPDKLYKVKVNSFSCCPEEPFVTFKEEIELNRIKRISSKRVRQTVCKKMNKFDDSVSIRLSQNSQLITSKTRFKKQYLNLKQGCNLNVNIFGNDVEDFLSLYR